MMDYQLFHSAIWLANNISENPVHPQFNERAYELSKNYNAILNRFQVIKDNLSPKERSAHDGVLAAVMQVNLSVGHVMLRIIPFDEGCKAIRSKLPQVRKALERFEKLPKKVNPFVARLADELARFERKTVGRFYPPVRSKNIPLEEAEILVREWLTKNAKDNPSAITRDAVSAATGVGTGSVSRTKAWKVFRTRRDAEAKPRERGIPLTDSILATIPSNAERPDKLASLGEEKRAKLAALIKEQADEEAEQDRRHKGPI